MKANEQIALDDAENDALAHGPLAILKAAGPEMEDMGDHAGEDGEIGVMGVTPQPRVCVVCYRHVVFALKSVR